MGELEAGGQKIQTSSYKINSGDLMYSMMTIVNNTILLTTILMTKGNNTIPAVYKEGKSYMFSP